MRTNINIDDKLMTEALNISGYKTKKNCRRSIKVAYYSKKSSQY